MVTVGAGASGVGEDTVADITLAVMLGEPAELGVASGGAAGAEAVGVALAGSELAVGSGTVVVDAGSLFVATLVPGCVEPKLTVIELGGLAAGAGEVGVVFTARSEYIFTAGALAWAAGTLPDQERPCPETPFLAAGCQRWDAQPREQRTPMSSVQLPVFPEN